MAAILSGVTPLLQVTLLWLPRGGGNLRPFFCSGGDCARGADNHWLWHEALHYFGP
jgi:hypothetical protein